MANRVGYILAKKLLSLEGAAAVDVIYVDEIARATRDGIETLLLGNLVQQLGKRIVGVSDGFDSRDEFSRMKLHFFAMFNEQFITQHRQKVVRVKTGALRRGSVLGRCAFGINFIPAVDSQGQAMHGRNGRQVNEYCLDEEMRPYLELIAQRFVDEKKSLYQITRELNQLRVGGRASWSSSGLLHVLSNEVYAGIYIYHRDHHIRDPITGTVKINQYPRRETSAKFVVQLSNDILLSGEADAIFRLDDNNPRDRRLEDRVLQRRPGSELPHLLRSALRLRGDGGGAQDGNRIQGRFGLHGANGEHDVRVPGGSADRRTVCPCAFARRSSTSHSTASRSSSWRCAQRQFSISPSARRPRQIATTAPG